MADDKQRFEITGDDVTGWTAKLETGQVYKGATKDAVLNEVVNGQVNSSMTLQQKEQELQEARRIIADHERRNGEYEQQQQQRHGDGGEEQQLTREQFNRRYWELINTDPFAAVEYANQYYYGDPNPRATHQKSAIVSEYVSDNVATREFLNDNPDFPRTPENSEKMLRELTNRDLEVTSYNLERVYKDLKRDNMITPLTAEQIADEQAELRNEARAATGGGDGTKRKRGEPPLSPNSTTERETETQNQMSEDQYNKFAVMNKSERERILREKGMM